MSQGSQARTVGARLREAREKRGVSLAQIANATRISVMSLEALERSDLSRLPGGIFTRSFIRAYAEEVGLDPDRTIQDFIAELPAEAWPSSAAGAAAVEDGEALESDRKAFATAMKLILVSVPIIGAMIYFGMHPLPGMRRPAVSDAPGSGGADGPPRIPNPQTTTAVAPPTDAPAPAAAMGTAPPAAVPATAMLTMEITTKADCWVSVTVDGEPLFSTLMHQGDTRRLSGRDEISVSVGDAGAFRYTLNGKPGRPLGAPGEVVSRRFTLANSSDYVSP